MVDVDKAKRVRQMFADVRALELDGERIALKYEDLLEELDVDVKPWSEVRRQWSIVSYRIQEMFSAALGEK